MSHSLKTFNIMDCVPPAPMKRSGYRGYLA